KGARRDDYARLGALAHRAHGARGSERAAPRRMGAHAEGGRAARRHPRRGRRARKSVRDGRVERVRQRRAQRDRRLARPQGRRSPMMDVDFVAPDLRRLEAATQAELVACAIWEDERPMTGLAGLLDWRLAGRLSRLARDGFLAGTLGEVLFVPGRPRLPFEKV